MLPSGKIHAIYERTQPEVYPTKEGDMRMRVHHIPEVRRNGSNKEKPQEDSKQGRKQKIPQGNKGVLFQICHVLKVGNLRGLPKEWQRVKKLPGQEK